MMKHDRSAYCYRVRGLHVPYETPPNIDKEIDRYIDRIERLTEQLENSFNCGSTSEFISALEKILEMTRAVYATQCESFAVSLINAARTRGLDYCDKLLQQSIADFILLSIEMQKAQSIGTNISLKYRNIEKNEEVARSHSAIARFISIADYEKAKAMAADLKDLDNSFVKMLELLNKREFGKAKDLAAITEKEHREIITGTKANAQISKVVLAVDDRPEILASVSGALRSHYKVLGAPSGMVAMDIIGRQKIDLFYLDIDMPEMDGFELCRKIRSMPNHKNTPVIFLTGNASRDNIMRAVKLGISDFIVKPANNQTLLVKARANLD